MNECISCIKDGITGKCRDIKDKHARADIEELKEIVKELGGVDLTKLQGDITSIQDNISELQNLINNLDLTYATDQDIQDLQTDINEIVGRINNLDNTYATDQDIQTVTAELTRLNNGLTELYNTVDGNVEFLQKVERVDVVYDKNSTDIAINLGYTSGINTDLDINIDLSKYKKIKCYFDGYPRGGIMEYDLNFASTMSASGMSNVSAILKDNGVLYVYQVNVLYKNNILNFTFSRLNDNNNGDSVWGYCYKIEGVY